MSWFRKPHNDKPEPVKPIATLTLTPAEPVTLAPDQMPRKVRSEARLTAHGVPFITHLPCIESEAEALSRSAQEVADRLLALTIVAVKGEGLEQAVIMEIVEERAIAPLFSPAERAFIDDPEPDDHARIQFSWRYEAAWVLLWALRLTDAPLGFPGEVCDVPCLAATVRDTADLAHHGVRPLPELLDEADLIYRYHWAVTQARIDGEHPPAGLDGGVVMERHKALNWLIHYMDAEWDDVTTDT